MQEKKSNQILVVGKLINFIVPLRIVNFIYNGLSFICHKYLNGVKEYFDKLIVRNYN